MMRFALVLFCSIEFGFWQNNRKAFLFMLMLLLLLNKWVPEVEV
jgi:hypothetical protein